ncbi:MAG: ribosome-binding ATPase YchF [Candidatus Binatia bacterium]|nr:MAG: ribosome-binding ATPase YchF [Candidatus Binatia bacterium]
MKVGIVGFPRSGKSTIFTALSGVDVPVGHFTESGVVHRGTIKVPDPRVDELARRFRPRKVTYAEIVFVDFPPPAPGRSESALDPATIAQMREMDALVQVVRGFTDPLSGEPPAPVRDLEAFKSELVLNDLMLVERRLERLKKERGRERERALLETLREALEAERPLRTLNWTSEDTALLSGFGFLSRKPFMVVLNVAEGQAREPMPAEVQVWLDGEGVPGIVLAGQIEMEISKLPEDDRAAFLADLGLSSSARDRFIRKAYELLELISFLTTGEDEVRAWTIRRGTTAVKAAGKIHSDIERGFIRAEVVAYDDFVQCGSEAKAREAGKLRLEGKDYVVRDGDIIHFRFNV